MELLDTKAAVFKTTETSGKSEEGVKIKNTLKPPPSPHGKRNVPLYQLERFQVFQNETGCIFLQKKQH